MVFLCVSSSEYTSKDLDDWDKLGFFSSPGGIGRTII